MLLKNVDVVHLIKRILKDFVAPTKLLRYDRSLEILSKIYTYPDLCAICSHVNVINIVQIVWLSLH